MLSGGDGDPEDGDGLSLDEFKSMLYQSLRAKGVVDSMKVCHQRKSY